MIYLIYLICPKRASFAWAQAQFLYTSKYTSWGKLRHIPHHSRRGHALTHSMMYHLTSCALLSVSACRASRAASYQLRHRPDHSASATKTITVATAQRALNGANRRRFSCFQPEEPRTGKPKQSEQPWLAAACVPSTGTKTTRVLTLLACPPHPLAPSRTTTKKNTSC